MSEAVSVCIFEKHADSTYAVSSFRLWYSCRVSSMMPSGARKMSKQARPSTPRVKPSGSTNWISTSVVVSVPNSGSTVSRRYSSGPLGSCDSVASGAADG